MLVLILQIGRHSKNIAMNILFVLFSYFYKKKLVRVMRALMSSQTCHDICHQVNCYISDPTVTKIRVKNESE